MPIAATVYVSRDFENADWAKSKRTANIRQYITRRYVNKSRVRVKTTRHLISGRHLMTNDVSNLRCKFTQCDWLIHCTGTVQYSKRLRNGTTVEKTLCDWRRYCTCLVQYPKRLHAGHEVSRTIKTTQSRQIFKRGQTEVTHKDGRGSRLEQRMAPR